MSRDHSRVFWRLQPLVTFSSLLRLTSFFKILKRISDGALVCSQQRPFDSGIILPSKECPALEAFSQFSLAGSRGRGSKDPENLLPF
jgi:hypothetical protein